MYKAHFISSQFFHGENPNATPSICRRNHFFLPAGIGSCAIRYCRPGNPPDNQAIQKGFTRVTGIGGIFIKAKDPAMLRAWYKQHLGIDVKPWGGTAFRWTDASGKPTAGSTAWTVGDGKMVCAKHFNIHGQLPGGRFARAPVALRAEGCDVMDKTDESEFGKFGWVMDPEGNKIELWEPPAGK